MNKTPSSKDSTGSRMRCESTFGENEQKSTKFATISLKLETEITPVKSPIITPMQDDLHSSTWAFPSDFIHENQDLQHLNSNSESKQKISAAFVYQHKNEQEEDNYDYSYPLSAAELNSRLKPSNFNIMNEVKQATNFPCAIMPIPHPLPPIMFIPVFFVTVAIPRLDNLSIEFVHVYLENRRLYELQMMKLGMPIVSMRETIRSEVLRELVRRANKIFPNLKMNEYHIGDQQLKATLMEIIQPSIFERKYVSMFEILKNLKFEINKGSKLAVIDFFVEARAIIERSGLAWHPKSQNLIRALISRTYPPIIKEKTKNRHEKQPFESTYELQDWLEELSISYRSLILKGSNLSDEAKRFQPS